MAPHRRFSFEFKRQVVLDVLEERVGLPEMARKHIISRSLIRHWIRQYETGQTYQRTRRSAYRRVLGQDRRAGAQGRPADNGS